ncbi:hypothetical protein MTR67_024612 [Solanum verrucosum]|uniref:Uncharacterized protein n=1 Tax=Solanum verrucosum TaxID=315347 RepID=A0AAF0QVN0_SOLVR|nr:hypothetical protein MTR67_024612 [Solanum verrucosum]
MDSIDVEFMLYFLLAGYENTSPLRLCIDYILSRERNGLVWYHVDTVRILFFFGVYLVGGAVYRYYSLGIRGIDIIPNLEFWASLPHTLQSSFTSLVRRFRGPSHGHRSSYSPVNF